MIRLPLIARLLTRCAPADSRDEIAGDLVEVHENRRRTLGAVPAWFVTSGDAAVVLTTLLASEGTRAIGAQRIVSGTELRLGFRLAARQPFLSMTASLAMAVGIGLATTTFTVANGTVFATLPFPAGDRFVDLDFRRIPGRVATTPPAAGFRQLRARATLLQHVGAYRTAPESLGDPGSEASLTPVRAAYLTPTGFGHFATPPVIGRALLPADAARDAEPVIVLGEEIWQRRWGGDRNLVGRRIRVRGETRTVVGVMPAAFGFPDLAEAWMPLDAATLGGSIDAAHPGVEVYGVLGEGAGVSETTAQVQALFDGVMAESGVDDGIEVTLTPFTRAGTAGAVEQGAAIAAMVLVLIVIAANVANLNLARIYGRQSELAVRTALGAARARLVGQIFAEVIVLVGAAAIVGLLGSQALLRWLTITVVDFPFWVDFSPDLRVMTFSVGLALTAGVVAGVLPALRATRGNVADALHAAGRTGAVRFGRFSSAMILAQVALCVALLSGAAVLGRALAGRSVPSPHLPAGQVLVARIYFQPPFGPQRGRQVSETWQTDSIAAVQGRIVRRIEQMSGVAELSFTNNLPRAEPGLSRIVLEPLPGDVDTVETAFTAPVAGITPRFFATLGIEPLAGTEFAVTGADSAAREVLVNQPFVDRYLGGRNAVGRRLRFPRSADDAPPQWHTIIGVVPDVGMNPGQPQRAGGVYTRLGGSNYFHVVLRPEGGHPEELAAELRSAVASVPYAVRLDDIMLIERAGWESRALLGGLSTALAVLGVMTLLLSAMGLYAIIAFTVTRRTREIGIRMALGSSHRGVLFSILGRSVKQLVVGAIAGIALAIAVTKATQVLPIHIAPAEPWLGPLVASVMVLAGILAAWQPARRALRIDPVEALRFD